MNAHNILRGLAICFAMALAVEPAFAGTAGTAMPWDGPITAIQQSLTGPIAIGVTLIAIAVGGMMLIFGGEMNDFARRIIMIVIVGALINGANIVFTNLYGTGAVLPIQPENTLLVITN